MLSTLRLLLCAITFWGLPGGFSEAGLTVSEAEVYLDKIERRIMAVWKLPPKSDGLKVTLRYTLTLSGSVSLVRVEKGSGNPSFDDSAVQAVRRANPFPPPPKTFPIGDLRMILDPTLPALQSILNH